MQQKNYDKEVTKFDQINNNQSQFCGAECLYNWRTLFVKIHKNINIISGTWHL